MESSSNESKDVIEGSVISLIKLKVKNLVFPIKTLWQAIKQQLLLSIIIISLSLVDHLQSRIYYS